MAQEQPGRHPQDAVRAASDVIAQGVDTRTRDYSYSHTDLVLPDALGPHVAVTRVFDANVKREGPFGIGWSLEIGPEPPASTTATLNGDRYDYVRQADATPLLARVTDRHGNIVLYHYNGSRLVSVETEYADRRHGYALTSAYSLAIHWNVSDPRHPRVTSIDSFQESPARRRLQTVTYGYANGISHSVTSECSPEGRITRYAYHRWTQKGGDRVEDDLLAAISDADGATTGITYNDTADDSYASWRQPDTGNVEVASVTDPAGVVTEFVPAGTAGGASGTHLITRHTERLPGGSDGYSVRSVYYVPDNTGMLVVSGWHSLGVERHYDRAGLLTAEDDRAGFGWNHRVPAKLLAPPRADMDYDDRFHFWTLVDMMHAVFWQDVFSPGVPHTQLLDGGIVSLRKTYSYDNAGRQIRSTVQGFPFTPDQSLPKTAPLTYTRRTAYWGPEKYGQKRLEIDPAGRRVYYDYCDSHAAPELRGNLRAVYADVSAGIKDGRPISYNPFDRPLGLEGAAALDAHPRANAVPVQAIDRFDPLGLPQTIRSLKALSPPRFAIEQRGLASMPLGSGRVPGGEGFHREYTPGGRLLSVSGRIGNGPLIRRTARYEIRDGRFTGRLAEMDETWDGAPRFRMTYTYGGYGNEDLIRKTLTVTGHPDETWIWDYNGEFSAAGIAARRIPARIVQTAPKASALPVQAVDYLYDSCLGELGLVRFGVADDDPSELMTQRLQDQHPSRFTFAWYAHDSFGRVYDLRLYRAQRNERRYVYTPLARTEYFRLKPDTGNLSGYDPSSFTAATAPFDPAGNIRFRQEIVYAPGGKTPRSVQNEMRAYDLDDRLASATGQRPLRSTDATMGDWMRAARAGVGTFDSLAQPLWSPGDTFEPGAPLSRRIRSGGSGYTDIFFDDGLPLMERDYDRTGRLLRTRTRLLGARGTEAVTEIDAHGRSRIDWLLDDGQGHVTGSMPGDSR